MSSERDRILNFGRLFVEQEWTGVVVVVMLVFAPGFGNEGLIDWRQI